MRNLRELSEEHALGLSWMRRTRCRERSAGIGTSTGDVRATLGEHRGVPWYEGISGQRFGYLSKTVLLVGPEADLACRCTFCFWRRIS